jgi:hypothetical protein
MSYVGQTLPIDRFSGYLTETFTGDGSTTAFTLTREPHSESAIIVVINNVVQQPVEDYTVSGTTLTIDAAVASGDVIYATHTGGVLPVTEAASIDLQGVSDALVLDADADTTISADTDDQIDFKAGGTDTLFVTNGKVGITNAPDLGAGLHIKTADSGASAPANYDEAVLENSGHCGMTILSGTSSAGAVRFGDSGDNDIGGVIYDHNTNTMTFKQNAATQFSISGSTAVTTLAIVDDEITTGGETSGDVGTGGITLNQGASDNNIITFKSSDIAHGITTQGETDTYAEFVKSSATLGGVSFNGYSEDDPGVTINGYIATETQTEITASHGGIHLNSGLKSGTDVGALNADGNIVVMRNNTGTQCIFKGDGEIFSNQTATVGTYDAFEDAQLARAYDLSHGKGVINSQFDKFVQYNSQDLVDARLIGKDEDGNATGFANITGFMRLHNGAIWQQYEKHQKLANAVFELAKAAIGEEKANEILEENDIKLLN